MDPEIRQNRPWRVPEMRHGARAGVARTGRAHGVDLPDAPGDRPRGARVLPDLRHGPRAAGRDARRGEPGAGRHDQAVARLGSAHGAYPRVHGFGVPPRSASAAHRATRVDDVVTVRARNTGGSLGWLAVLRARLGLDRQPAPEHVHADRAGRGRRVWLQRRRDAGAGLFPDSFRTHGGQVGVYFEPAAVIVVLVLLGQVLELRARSRTGAAIRRLLGLTPATARRIDAEGLEQDVPLEQVQVGDRLRVRPGERVPVDGSLWTEPRAWTSRC